jgi:hypothetical protein
MEVSVLYGVLNDGTNNGTNNGFGRAKSGQGGLPDVINSRIFKPSERFMMKSQYRHIVREFINPII